MDLTKEQLEVLISEERPIGEFIFDEKEQYFFTYAPVRYELVEIEENVYTSGEYIYFDDYEYIIEENEQKTLIGTLEEVEENLSQEYNEENSFMNYRVFYLNFKVVIV